MHARAYPQRVGPRDDRDTPFHALPPAHARNTLSAHPRRAYALRNRLGRISGTRKLPEPGDQLANERFAIIIMLSALIMLSVIAIVMSMGTDALMVWGIVIITFAFLANSHLKRTDAEAVIAMSLVAEGICGCCGFPLEGLKPDRDNRIVCPECGHAFDSLRIVRPFWEPAPRDVPPKSDPRPDIRAAARLTGHGQWVVDDNTRCVHTPDSYLSGVGPEIHRQLPTAQRKQLTRRLRAIGRLPRAIAMVNLIALSIFGLFVFSDDLTENQSASRITMMIGLLLPAAIGVLVYFSDAWCSPGHVTKTLFNRGRCGSCANDLTGTPVNERAMRVCEHCGSSWRDDRFPRLDPATIDTHAHHREQTL